MGAPLIWIGELLFKHNAIIHERSIPLPRLEIIKCFFNKREDINIFDILFAMKKEMDKYPADICFYKNWGKVKKGASPFC